MKKIFLFLLLIISFVSYGQTYNPAKFTVSNKSYGVAQSVPTDARSQFYDETNFVMRDYQSTTEVNSYLSVPKFRAGHFLIYIHNGGSLSGGVWTGGTTDIYIYKDGIADGNLVPLFTNTTVSNTGSGFRIVKPISGVDYPLRSLASSNTIIWDSTSNSNSLTGKVDTSLLVTINRLSDTAASIRLAISAGGGGITTLTGDVTASGTGSVAANIANNVVSNAKFRQSAALSVVGRTSNSTGNVADIAAATSGHVLRRNGTTLDFGTIDSVSVPLLHSEAYYDSKYSTIGIDSVYVSNAGNNGVETSFISGDTLKTKKLYEQEGAVLTRESDSSISIKTKVTELASYTAMRALATSVIDANYVYIVRASGVQGNFRYDATDTWSADDSAMVIVTGSGKRFKRVTDGYLNAAWFGAIPDDGVDDSWAFQKMFNYIDTSTVLRDYKIFIPGGKYQVATSVTLPQTIYNPGSGSIPRVNIEGDGAVIFVTGAITAWKRLVTDITTANNVIGSYFISISGIEFTGDATTGQKGLELHAIYGADIADMRFTALDTGMVIRFALGSQFRNIFYTNNKSVGFFGASLYGVATGATTSNSAFNANTVTKNRVYCGNGSYAGMMYLSADGCYFRDNIIEGSKPRYSFYFDSEGSSVVNGNHIQTMWFEANGGTYTNNTSMKLRVNGIFTIDGIQNDSPDTLIDWSSSAAGADISLDNVEYWNFSGGKWFKGTPSSGMVFRVGRIYGTLTENFFNSTYYNDGIPADVFTLYGYQTSGGGYGIASSSQMSIKPSPNAATTSQILSTQANIRPSVNNTYDIGSGSLGWKDLYIKNRVFGGGTSDDGSGAKIQSSGHISMGDGSVLTEPAGISRIQLSSAGGTRLQYFSGGSYGTVEMNPHLSYLYASVEKFRVSSAGEVWINPAGVADLGAFTLQNTGGLYQQGSFRLGGTRVATSNDVKLLVKGESDSTVAQLDFPIVQSTYSVTLTNTTNIASSSTNTTYYERRGNVIHVWGTFTAAATAGGSVCEMGFSIPVASGFTNVFDLGGSGSSDTDPVKIIADATNDRAKFRFTPAGTGSTEYSFHFTYWYIAP